MAKGIVTNTIQYRGFNSIRMDPGAKFRCFPFATDGMTHISHAVPIYSVNALTGAVRARTRFIGANGLRLSIVNHTFATPTGTFEEIKIEAVPVPTGAKFAILEFVSPTGTYWLSMPKTEEGERCTPYSANFTGQMTFITPTGVYTGVVTAGQIVLPGGQNLEEAMVTINNRLVELTSTTRNQGSSITRNTNQITALGNKIVSIETIQGQTTRDVTDIKAGKITLSSETRGTLAGMTLTSDRLEFSSNGAYFRIMARPGYEFLRAGTSATNPATRIDYSGRIYATGATISGDITALTGKIGAWVLSDRHLMTPDQKVGIGVSSGSGDALAFWSGYDGRQYKFKVTHDGKVYAVEGEIGDWLLTPQYLQSRNESVGIGLNSLGGTNPAFWAGYTKTGGYKFLVRHNGGLLATNAEITGTIKAGSVFAGNLQDASGTVSSLGGTVSNLGGTVSGISGSTGALSGESWSGPTYGGGTFSGGLSSTTGNHNGSVYSATGKLGGIEFISIDEILNFRGSVGVRRFNCAEDGVFNGVVYGERFQPNSDRRLKENIESIDADFAITELKKLNIVEFDFIASKQHSIGIVAQEVVKNSDRRLSDVVIRPNEGYFTADYNSLSMLTIPVLQNLLKRVEKLEGK